MVSAASRRASFEHSTIPASAFRTSLRSATILPRSGTITPRSGSILARSVSITPHSATILPQSVTILPRSGKILPAPGTISGESATISPCVATILPRSGTIAPRSARISRVQQGDPVQEVPFAPLSIAGLVRLQQLLTLLRRDARGRAQPSGSAFWVNLFPLSVNGCERILILLRLRQRGDP